MKVPVFPFSPGSAPLFRSTPGLNSRAGEETPRVVEVFLPERALWGGED